MGDPPVTFTYDILAAARAAGLVRGLYIGCGNGRNYLPLVAGGLDLTGLDISAVAIAQLAARAPTRRDRLVCGDLKALPAEASYPLVVGIQVFQHGDRHDAHAHIRAAQQRVGPDGLFCLRVNTTATDIWPENEVTERDADDGLTVRYLAGPKQGLHVHTDCDGRSWTMCLLLRNRCSRACCAPDRAVMLADTNQQAGGLPDPPVRPGRAARRHADGLLGANGRLRARAARRYPGR